MCSAWPTATPTHARGARGAARSRRGCASWAERNGPGEARDLANGQAASSLEQGQSSKRSSSAALRPRASGIDGNLRSWCGSATPGEEHRAEREPTSQRTRRICPVRSRRLAPEMTIQTGSRGEGGLEGAPMPRVASGSVRIAPTRCETVRGGGRGPPREPPLPRGSAALARSRAVSNSSRQLHAHSSNHRIGPRAHQLAGLLQHHLSRRRQAGVNLELVGACAPPLRRDAQRGRAGLTARRPPPPGSTLRERSSVSSTTTSGEDADAAGELNQASW